MAQSWEEVTTRQAANYNKKYNYRTFERGSVVGLSIKNFRFKNGRKFMPYYILMKIMVKIGN